MVLSRHSDHGRIVRSRFKPHPLMAGAHVQTIFPTLIRPRPRLPFKLERIELPDEDFIDVGWAGSDSDLAPIAVLVHGLGGGLQSKYVLGLGWRLVARGWRVCAVQQRGAGEEPNRLPLTYNHGLTGDLRHLWQLLRKRHPQAFLTTVGWSLGGNVLLKALGEEGPNAPIDQAFAVSVPFALADSERHLRQGFARVYQNRLLGDCKTLLRRKLAASSIGPPADIAAALEARNFYEFDAAFTAPLNAYRDCEDYYDRASCSRFLRDITVPTRILYSLDDPFMARETAPSANDMSAAVTLELSEFGGHVGFVSANAAGLPYCWSEEHICRQLTRAREAERGSILDTCAA